MLADERTFKSSLTTVFQSALLIFVLYLLRIILPKIPGMNTLIGPMSASGYAQIIVALAAVPILLRTVGPLRVVAGTYLAGALHFGNLPDKEKYEDYSMSLCNRIIYLVVLIVVYGFVADPVNIIGRVLLHTNALSQALGIVALVVGLLIVFGIWISAKPLITLVSSHAGERIGDASGRILYRKCPKCGGMTDKAAKFCSSCGSEMEAES